jgi:hypothetical protein
VRYEGGQQLVGLDNVTVVGDAPCVRVQIGGVVPDWKDWVEVRPAQRQALLLHDQCWKPTGEGYEYDVNVSPTA